MAGARLDIQPDGPHANGTAADVRGWAARGEPRLGWPAAAALVIAASAGLWLGIWSFAAGLLR